MSSCGHLAYRPLLSEPKSHPLRSSRESRTCSFQHTPRSLVKFGITSGAFMIRTYRFAPAYTQHRWEPPIPEEVLQEALWIDLEDPSPEEVAQIESYFQVRFPSSQEEAEIEASSRYQVEDDYVRISLRLLELCVGEGNGPFLQEQSLSVLWLPTKFITLRKRQTRKLAELVRRLKTA